MKTLKLKLIYLIPLIAAIVIALTVREAIHQINLFHVNWMN